MNETSSSTLVVTLPSAVEIKLTREFDAQFEFVLETVYPAGTCRAVVTKGERTWPN